VLAENNPATFHFESVFWNIQPQQTDWQMLKDKPVGVTCEMNFLKVQRLTQEDTGNMNVPQFLPAVSITFQCKCK